MLGVFADHYNDLKLVVIKTCCSVLVNFAQGNPGELSWNWAVCSVCVCVWAEGWEGVIFYSVGQRNAFA